MTCSGSPSWAGKIKSKHKKQKDDRNSRIKIPSGVRNLLKSRRKPNRLMEVYKLLLRPVSWVSASDLNSKLKYVKRTLQGTLNRLVELGLVKKTRSLSDARVTLFRAIFPPG